MDKQLKHLKFPESLIRKIEKTEMVPDWADFTTRVFMLLEQALTDPTKKKVSDQHCKPSELSTSAKPVKTQEKSGQSVVHVSRAKD